MRTTRITSIAIIFLGIIFLAACASRQTEEPPGVGEKAERGYAVCNPIIEALEGYKAANGTYPSSLAELVPDTIASVPTEVNGQPIMYKQSGESYSLSFAYTGPGMNICTYSPDSGREWRCSGAY